MKALAVLVAAVALLAPAASARPAAPACVKPVAWRTLTLIAAGSAAVDNGFPQPDGPTDAVLADGHGGWFVGGRFTCVGGVRRDGLAHLEADGRLDSAWRAPVPVDRASPDPSDVLALARVGGTLYAAGGFGVEALDAATGARRWLTRASGNPVHALAANSERVYAGGAFDRVAGRPHRSLVVLSPATGRPLPWQVPVFGSRPLTVATADVESLALDRGRLFVGGDMTSVDGRPRSWVSALDARTGRLTGWAPHRGIDGDVAALLVTHGRVFLSGLETYDVVDEQTARLDPLTDGTGGWRFAASGDTVYLAGNCRNSFDAIQGQPRNNLAAVDLGSGRITSWAPNLAEYTCVDAIAADADQVLVAGSFSATLG